MSGVANEQGGVVGCVQQALVGVADFVSFTLEPVVVDKESAVAVSRCLKLKLGGVEEIRPCVVFLGTFGVPLEAVKESALRAQ